MQIAIVGAGPIGLEAALAAVERGHDATVFEKGRVAENVRRWGHVRLFSPFAMNTSERGRAALRSAGHELPPDDALPTGREFIDSYLRPLASHLSPHMRENTSVLSIGRSRLSKGERIGSRDRARDPFRLLVRDEDGEHAESADVVLDCSGTFSHHRWLGMGGTPCPGERGLQDCLEYGLPDVLGRDVEQYAGRHTCVVGAGYSAATTVVALTRLAAESPGTRITWLVRANGPEPITRVPRDVLSVRDDLAAAANRLATGHGDGFAFLAGCHVDKVGDNGADGILVRVRKDDGSRETLSFDNVVANVGYKPDRSLYEELQVHECYASQGPMKLAASLLGETAGDCLAMESPGPEVLRNPEPNFFVLGSKSYGRDSRFLLRTGLQQVEDVFDLFVTPEQTNAGC